MLTGSFSYRVFLEMIILQEIAAHRKKFDMSVLAVAFHPSRPLIGSAGADSLAKIFSSQRIVGGVTSFQTDEESA